MVSETLAGRSDALKESALGRALGRVDFNPKADPIVRIHVRRLRKLLDDYYAADGSRETIEIRIPKGRYVPEIKSR